MKKIIRIQVELPATQVSSFAARKSVSTIVDGIEYADRIDAKYDVNAMHAFAQNLKGAAGTYEFDIVIDNSAISEAEEAGVMAEFIASLPATHKIIEPAQVAAPAVEDAEAFFNRVKKIEPGISGSVENGVIKGSYRGKSSNAFSYSFDDHQFNYNKGGDIITTAFEKALNSLS